jgi:hypothetical protein
LTVALLLGGASSAQVHVADAPATPDGSAVARDAAEAEQRFDAEAQLLDATARLNAAIQRMLERERSERSWGIARWRLLERSDPGRAFDDEDHDPMAETISGIQAGNP